MHVFFKGDNFFFSRSIPTGQQQQKIDYIIRNGCQNAHASRLRHGFSLKRKKKEAKIEGVDMTKQC